MNFIDGEAPPQSQISTEEIKPNENNEVEEVKVPQPEQSVENTTHGKFMTVVNKVWAFLKNLLSNMLGCTAFFVVVYLIAWGLNAVYANLHFDLGSLRDFYLMVIGKQTADHTVNSVFNSGKGLMPK